MVSQTARLSGNINSEDEKFESGGIGYITSQLNVYDSLGNTYSIMCRIENDVNDTTKYTMTPMAVFRGNEALQNVSAVFSGPAVAADGSIALQFDGTTGRLNMADTSFTLNVQDANGNLPAFL